MEVRMNDGRALPRMDAMSVDEAGCSTEKL